MKADAEWDAVQQKVRRTAVGWTGVRVVPLIASIPNESTDALVASVLAETDDLSAALPAPPGGGPGELVIGTLDVNFGATLPAEELVGSLSKVRSQRPPQSAGDCHIRTAVLCAAGRPLDCCSILARAAHSVCECRRTPRRVART